MRARDRLQHDGWVKARARLEAGRRQRPALWGLEAAQQAGRAGHLGEKRETQEGRSSRSSRLFMLGPSGEGARCPIGRS
jgi:hypothetical protein